MPRHPYYMYRIGEFSKLGKVSMATLRYYDEIGLLKPSRVDVINRYRSYSPEQLKDLCAIVRYRKAGLPLDDIRSIMDGEDPVPILERNLESAEGEMVILSERIDTLQRMIGSEGRQMYEVEVKELPCLTTAYRRGRIDTPSDLPGFVLEFARICHDEHPDMECTEDGYCFVTYDDPEYREEDIGLTYHQAIKRMGKPSEWIGFMTFDPVLAVCVRHFGPYDRMGEAYAALTEWMDQNEMELSEPPREQYIHGCWDVESESDYLTEIQFPIRLR